MGCDLCLKKGKKAVQKDAQKDAQQPVRAIPQRSDSAKKHGWHGLDKISRKIFRRRGLSTRRIRSCFVVRPEVQAPERGTGVRALGEAPGTPGRTCSRKEGAVVSSCCASGR